MKEHMLNHPHRYKGYQTNTKLELGTGWRWQCTCGSVGDWQYQSPEVCETKHERHVEKFVLKKLHKAGSFTAPTRRGGGRRSGGRR